MQRDRSGGGPRATDRGRARTLHSAGGRQALPAEQVAALCARVEGAGGDAAAAAGEPAAAAAMTDCAIAWSASLGMLAQSLGGLAANVGAAGTAYAATDANAMPAGPR